MADYTMELRFLADNPTEKVFDFPYDFYDESAKPWFEQKFINYYYFHEIGFETIDKFKHRLMTRLNTIARYYQQLYNTEIVSSEVNFMLNKDLKETFIRDVTNNSKVNSTMDNTTNTDNSADSTNIHSNTPQGRIDDIERYMTSADKTKDTNTTTSIDTNVANSINDSNGKETTELISQGNIGITASGSLLKDWGEILINIEERIL